MPKKTVRIKASETYGSSDTTSRQRQSKKDEALRKKLELEFSKKTNHNSRTLSRRIPGTVSALKPNLAVIVKENMPVIESAQFMAAKRSDCILVVNEEDQLSGIFTAKDIAYRLVAEGLDARTTPVRQIMTRNPLCVTSDTSATEALDLMVSRGFRHLPVCNEEGDIFGLLDITKCLYEALQKMERAFGSSEQLYAALEGVDHQWSDVASMNNYIQHVRDSMCCPTLASVLDGTPPAQVRYKTNVREIAVMMKELHTTAVLVTKTHTLQGIFTSKDIVLRVIAAGLSPDNCTVARVMTPTPDTASPDTTILDALKSMNIGHYLNLPVIEDGTIVGMVDVLRLTYATLEQMNAIEGGHGEDGPMWGRFWDSFGGDPSVDNQSQLTDSHSQLSDPALFSPQASTSFQTYSDILPSESASMVHHSRTIVSEDGTFAFKFTLSGQKTHRVISKPIYRELLDRVRLKLPQGGLDRLHLSYLDDEQDYVLMTSDADVLDAVQLALKTRQNNVKLYIQDASTPASLLPTPIPSLSPPTKKKTRKTPQPSYSLSIPSISIFLGVVVFGACIYLTQTRRSL
ncbi:hypothetical protein BY458DRAFT_514139 [Sporodiniella umbellata]|nr:hypothetical protein BY458DRAFT_514139 [Sporodiniella umbellata]